MGSGDVKESNLVEPVTGSIPAEGTHGNRTPYHIGQASSVDSQQCRPPCLAPNSFVVLKAVDMP